MLPLVRRLAVLSAISVAFSSAPLSAQSQPAHPIVHASEPCTSAFAGRSPSIFRSAATACATTRHVARTARQTAPPSSASHSKRRKKDNDKPIDQADIHNASLWRDPGDISAKNLFYGDGGKDGQPVPPFNSSLKTPTAPTPSST